MKKFLLIFGLAIFAFVNTDAKIWRVNNVSGVNADYSTFVDAVTAATAGDTIYLEASATSYSGTNVTKKLYVFGPGYFFDNPITQATPIGAKLDYFYCGTGSEGSMITGVTIGYVDLRTNNITIKRNYIYYASSIDCIKLNGSANNAIISQNYIHHEYSSSSYKCIDIEVALSGIIINNNTLIKNTPSTGIAFYMHASASATIINNNIEGIITINNSTFHNNIMTDGGSFTSTSSDVQNNLCNATQIDTTGGNQQNVDMNTVYEYTGTTDAQYKLKVGSPAIDAGVSGEDCGMFGGNNPYVLSGMPNIPSIYFFSAPITGSPSQGLNVRIKAASHK